MVSPNLPVQFKLPIDGGTPMTYPELLRQLSCITTAGIRVNPSPVPTGTANTGDIIADISQALTVITSGYAILAEIIKFIMCMMNVICSINNPFALIKAMIKLFTKCLPDFILIFPQLAVPSFIICILKIIIAIVRFILETIIPIIEDIIKNINDIIDAITDQNLDAINATAFKIVQLLKMLVTILGIFSVLNAIIIMIKALIDAITEMPCLPGGICDSCDGDDTCPNPLKGFSIDGIDGKLIVSYTGNASEYKLYFTSLSKRNDFILIKDFFPNVNYNSIDIDKLAYKLEVNNKSYAVTSVDNGTLNLAIIENPLMDDGYLSSVYNNAGVATAFTDPSNQIRFATKTETFAFTSVNDYLILNDLDSGGSLNSGTFKIEYVFDGYNVRLTKNASFGNGSGWVASNLLNPSCTGSGCSMIWRYVLKAPSPLIDQDFSIKINHEELLRHSMIGLGCHPKIAAHKQALSNRFPFINKDIPVIPSFMDINIKTGNINAFDNSLKCLGRMIPENLEDLNMNYVFDNYNVIKEDALTAQMCLTSTLNQVESDAVNYSKELYPRLFSSEKSTIIADKYIQFVNGDIEITLKVIDIYGNNLGSRLSPGVIEAKLFSTFGTLSSVIEVLENGKSTGEFKAILTSPIAGLADITGSVADIFVSDFIDDYDETHQTPHLVNRVITVEFIDLVETRRKKSDGSVEPLGISSTKAGK